MADDQSLPDFSRRRGRPPKDSPVDHSILTEDDKYVLDLLADGALLSEVAEEIGVKRTALYTRLHNSPAKSDAYMRAREHGLQARGEMLRRLSRTVLPVLANGGVDSGAVAQLRLQIETEKWTLGKLLPYVYGDKLDVAHSGAVAITAIEIVQVAARREGET